MASIKLNNLAKTKSKTPSGPSYTYVDLFLDLQSDKVSNNLGINAGANFTGDINNNRDIRIAPDEQAIKNSLINLFNTQPGQRILLPDYGVNLLGYVFEPVSEITADALGSELVQAIRIWEPRVILNLIEVLADPDNNQYFVTINVSVPSLKQKGVRFTGIISSEGFTETNSSEFV